MLVKKKQGNSFVFAKTSLSFSQSPEPQQELAWSTRCKVLHLWKGDVMRGKYGMVNRGKLFAWFWDKEQRCILDVHLIQSLVVIYSEDKEQSYECVWDCRYQQLMLSYEYQSINICATFF